MMPRFGGEKKITAQLAASQLPHSISVKEPDEINIVSVTVLAIVLPELHVRDVCVYYFFVPLLS